MNAANKLTVLLIGSGGREHALVNKVLESPSLDRLFVAPGNPGTAANNVDLDVNDFEVVVVFCQENNVDLVIVGPEVPLVAGIADLLAENNIACFGPSKAAAQLEGSKAFTRDFARRHNIPGPKTGVFSEVEDAIAWLDSVDFDVVVKADGLASGKGVVIPEGRVETERAIFEMLVESSMGDAGSVVLLEERMTGEELSLFGISSANQTDPLGGLTAQDHKRVGVGDTGLNTGGMGAFAPVPGFDPEFVAQLATTFLDPVTKGMAAEGTPYVGVIYAGIMLTPDGPRLVEYNCRFGDPETQVLMPLIEGDILEVFWKAATAQSWTPLSAKRDTSAVTVVVAADGYPTAPIKGAPIPDVELPIDVELIHAGTKQTDAGLISSGGRVLNVVATGPNLANAVAKSYSIVDKITGNGLFARSDIAWRHLSVTENSITAAKSEGAVAAGAYASAGVSLTAGAETTARIGAAVKSTHDDRVVSGLGSFGGVFDIAALTKMDEPLLVATTDGVGTKTVLAEQLDRWEGCGADIVNHGVNDVLVQGAEPLFFLDTVASEKLIPEVVGRIVDGMAAACREASCVLLGGETAEMPGVLTEGAVDIAGTLVGAVDRVKLLPRPGIAAGHVLVGIASSGLHTNGYSLARKVVADRDLNSPLPGGAGESIGDALLAVHRNYHPVLADALEEEIIDGLAHITGGGLIDNLPRILPDGVGAKIDTNSWVTPPLFQFLIDEAGLGRDEAHQILNCGIGMIVVVAADKVEALQALIPEETWVIGNLVDCDLAATGTDRVVLS